MSMHERVFCVIELNNLNVYKYTYSIYRVLLDPGEHTVYTYQTQ